jgi:UDP-GlcNAc:undecaprenyl-phosphate GlcNAc-1-phosphate transferase
MSVLTYTPWQVLDNWWIAAAAFGVSLIATPIARFVAYRTKIVDRPDDLLKPHGRPIAYLGGLAMCVGLLAGLAGYIAIMPDLGKCWSDILSCLASFSFHQLTHNPLWGLASIALASIVITIMGLMDDIYSLKPRQKIYWQIACAAILVAGGIGTEMSSVIVATINDLADLLGSDYRSVWPAWLALPVSALMCFVLVVATCNATNLLDGLDGLCGGVTAIIAIGFLALAVWLAMWTDRSNPFLADYNAIRVALCLAMAGAILGFLPYNIPPASIFMGDAGSMLLGFFVATMMAMFSHDGIARWLVAAVVVYSLPISDTALAVVRRFLAGKSIFAGDRSHLYDQLVDRGMSVKQVVVLFYILSALAAITGVLLAVLVRTRYSIVICIALAVIIWVIFHKMGMVHPPAKRTAQSGDGNKDQAQMKK